MPHHTKDELVLSYHRVRQALGVLGLSLPTTLIVGSLLSEAGLAPSISDFYHTSLRDIFVGTLCAIGIFLFSYRGYRPVQDEKISDDILATLAGITAFGLAFFPNEGGGYEVVSLTQVLVGPKLASVIHYACALVFFFCLGLFCYVKFPKTANPRRRRFYIWCGHVILVSSLAILAGSVLRDIGSDAMKDWVLRSRMIFWAEAAGVWAFALSWLIKGKADMSLLAAGQKLRVLPKS